MSGGTEIWDELVEAYKNQLTPMYWYMLDDARGTLEGDELVVRCGDDLTLETLNSPEITQVLAGVTGKRLGRDIRVRFAIGGGEAAPADKLDELIRHGQKFENFTVKP